MTAQNAGGVDALTEYQAMRAAWDKVGNRKWHEQECSAGPASEWFELGWKAARKYLSAVSPDAATVDDAVVVIGWARQSNIGAFTSDPWFQGGVCIAMELMLSPKQTHEYCVPVYARPAMQAARAPDGGKLARTVREYLRIINTDGLNSNYEMTLGALQAMRAALDSLPDGAGGKAVGYFVMYRDRPVGYATHESKAFVRLGDCETLVPVYTHPATEASLSREGASVSNAGEADPVSEDAVTVSGENFRKLLAGYRESRVAGEALRGLVDTWHEAASLLKPNDPYAVAGRDCANDLMRVIERYATPNPTTLAETADSYSGKVETAESVDGLVGEVGADRQVLRDALADLDVSSWECPRCGHSEECATMDVASMIRDYLDGKPTETPEGGVFHIEHLDTDHVRLTPTDPTHASTKKRVDKLRERDALRSLVDSLPDDPAERQAELVSFFRTDGAEMGRHGDAMGWTPEQTARHFLQPNTTGED